MKAHGFTLIELLVTLAIVAIISAVAVPQFNEYRKRGYDMRARTDLRHAAIAEETYFIDFEHYLSCEDDTCTDLPGISSLSDGVSLLIEADDESYIGTASHPSGTGQEFTWDSEAGGLQ